VTFTVIPSASRKLEKAERQRLALKLLNAGNPLPEIAKAIGASIPSTRQYIKEAIFEHPVEDLEGWRAVELTRLENLHRLVMEKLAARLGDDPEALDLRSVDRLLKIAERRAKLLGLDMPTKVEIDQGAQTRIIEVSAWPTDSAGQALAPPDQSVDEPEADRGDGGWDGERQDMVRSDLAAQEAH
jgi:hypothetical protein